MSDSLDVGAASGPAEGLLVEDDYGGGSFAGGRAGLVVNLIGNGTITQTSNGNLFYGAAQFNAVANTNAGGSICGTGTAVCGSGALNGINPEVSLQSGATYWQSLSGEEIDVEADTGSSVVDKVGLLIVQKSSNAVSGFSLTDSALSIGGSTPAAVGWNFGILLGGFRNGFPFQPSSTLIYMGQPQDPSFGQAVVAWGIDMTGGLFGSTILDTANPLYGNYQSSQGSLGSGFMKSTGLQIDGVGNLTAQSATVGNFSLLSTPAGLTVTAPNYKVVGYSIAAPGSSLNWYPGDKAITQNNGVYLVTTVKDYGATVVNHGAGGPVASTTVTVTLMSGYAGANCNPYPVFTGNAMNGTLSSGLSITTQGFCAKVPSGGGLAAWPAAVTPNGPAGVTINVLTHAAALQQLVADVAPQGSITATAALTATNCYNSGYFRTCGSGLSVSETWAAANDIILGGSVASTATTGFTHPFSTVTSAPTGTPASPSVPCVFNTSSSSIDCYNGTVWVGTKLTTGVE